ncbi:MAG: integrase arm-type DNA-binding domain-containing protein [Rudaea sp.]|uniref:tyrosine-type recombinase/integrase n=1 Tax=Rudaea sp. TaxID=2136325 RepID=UPI0039E6D01E
MLTDAKLRALKPRESVYRIADALGLAIEVRPTGTRWWRFRYRFNGIANMLTMGEYPGVSLVEARKRLGAARGLLDNGIDPSAQRKVDNEAAKSKAEHAKRGTFAAVAADWVAFKAKGWASETKRKAEFVLDRYLIPALGDRDIATLAAKDAAKPLLALAESAPNLARKARQYIGGIVRYAQREGLRDEARALPLAEVLPSFDKGNIPAVTTPDEVAKLIEAIQDYPAAVVRAALLCCAYTAQRPGVVAAMRWDEIKGEEWHIPGPKMKMRHAHIVSLPRQAVALLDEMKAFTGGREYVFPPLARQKTPHLHRDALSNALRRMGFAGQHATHGFRGMLRTVARERLGVAADVLEAQLAHAKKGEVQKAYDRTTFTDERRKAMQAWADYLDNLRVGGKVIPIKRRKA